MSGYLQHIGYLPNCRGAATVENVYHRAASLTETLYYLIINPRGGSLPDVRCTPRDSPTLLRGWR